MNHRPYWDYYILHFDVALSLAAGAGAGVAFEAFEKAVVRGIPAKLALPGAFAVFAILIGNAGSAAVDSAVSFTEAGIKSGRLGDSDDLPQVLSSFRMAGDLFSSSPLAAFYAEMPVIPELALLPLKRFWSGQISHASILATLRRIKPSGIILDTDYFSQPGCPDFLKENYQFYGQARGLALYKRISFEPPRDPGKTEEDPAR